MKKALLALVVIIVLAAAGAPFINGILMERTVREAFADLNAMYADTGVGYKLEIINWQRHFYSSEIEWKVDFGQLKTVYGIDEMIFVDHAKHGYTSVVSTTSLDKNPWFNRFIDERLGGRNPFNIQTSYSFFGEIKSHLQSDQFTLTMENEQLEVGEGDFTIQTDNELRLFKSSGSWQGFESADQVFMRGLSMDSELEMLSTFLWDGYMTMNIGEFKAKQPKGDLEYSDLTATYTLQVNDDRTLISGSTGLEIANLVAAGKTINGIKGTVAVGDMNAAGYEEFMRAYMNMFSELLANISELENSSGEAKQLLEEQMREVGFRLIAAYEKLLKKGLTLQLTDVLVKMEQGDIKADVTLKLLKDMTLMQFAPIVGQPSLALDIFHLQSDVTMPTALVGEPPQLLEPFYPGMPTGLFIKKEDTLTHNAETRDGKLLLNSKEFIFPKEQ